MKTFHRLVMTSACIWSLACPLALRAAPPLEFGLFIGGGYTLVNLEEASGYDEDYLTDWGQGHFKVTINALYGLNEKFWAGLEIGYHELYWWSARIPYGYTPAYREAEWWTDSYLVTARFDVTNRYFLQAGWGFHFFDGDPALAMFASTGFKLEAGMFSFPIAVRIDPIFGDGTPTPISFGVGVQFSFGKN